MKMSPKVAAVMTLFLLAVPAMIWSQKTEIAVIMPTRGQFLSVAEAIGTELGPKYDLWIIDINKPQRIKNIINQCKAREIKALVLMDTKAIHIVEKMQRQDSLFVQLPKFVLMTLTAQIASRGLKNVSGITFEVPAFTIVTHFRALSQKDFSKVGVFYREQVRDIIEQAQKRLLREEITLDAVCLDCDQRWALTPSEVTDKMKIEMKDMVDKRNVDVFWLMADTYFVNSSNIGTFWLGVVKKQKLPVIASIERLAEPEVGAAIFTADPDYTQLGVQSANQIIQLFEQHATPQEIGFEPSISIKSTVNLSVANDIGWLLYENKLDKVNNVVK